MNYKTFQLYFSNPRVNRYYYAANSSKRKTISLYKQNLLIAQAIHPVIGIFEVVLRNSIDAALCKHFQDENWIINQKDGFMSDSHLLFMGKQSQEFKRNDFLKREVIKAEQKLKLKYLKIPSIYVTPGNIIAEQSFSFWTNFFEAHHFKILKGKPIQIFRDLPQGIGRKEIFQKLNSIRQFRNRINHNEPICFVDNKFSYSEIQAIHQSIYELLRYIDDRLIDFLESIDNTEETLNHLR